MKKGLFTIYLLLAVIGLQAQGDISNLALEPQILFCKPGVCNKSPGKGLLIEYSYNPEFKMRPTNAEQPTHVEANKRFMAKIKVPLVNKDRVKFLLGFKYATEKYNFDHIDPENYPLFKRMNDATLKDAESAAYLILPINHNYYTSFRFSTSFRGDYGTFMNTNQRYLTYRAAGIFGVKKSENLEYGFGIYFSKNIRRSIAYPFGLLNWTFNDKWGLEAAIPVSIKIRHNINEGNIMLFGAQYSTQSYTLDTRDAFSTTSIDQSLFHYRRGSIETSVGYMKQMTGWTWMEFKLGYSININSDARDIYNGLEYDLRPTGSIVGTVSFFLSPPKKYLK